MRASQRVAQIEVEREGRSMAPHGKETGSFVVVNLDQVKQGVAAIESVLDALDIPVEVVESGRQLRWNAAVVLRIPEHRVAEAMLALGMKGFADVMAYQSRPMQGESGGRQSGPCGQLTDLPRGGGERC
jgi:hypothetical protein